MSVKLLAIDMDGTCLNSRNKISDETRKWLRRARAEGIEIVPTTGRTLTCLPYQLKEEALYRYVISSNGAIVTDVIENQNIFSALIPLETAMSLMQDCRGKGLGMTAHIDHEYLIQGKALTTLGILRYGRDSENGVTVKKLNPYAQKKQMDIEELQFFYFTKKAKIRTHNALEKYPNLAVSHGDCYVEIYSQNATKGIALAAVAKHLTISKEDLACIGDGENDIPMFQNAGICFAMGNAIPALKERASKVVASNNDDGVAEAIQFLLS